MQEPDDISLLHEYTEENSEVAFAALVERHINKVYSVALRHTRNPHQAEEITQAVFVILAKKAGGLGKRVILSGWLYQTARLASVTFLRSEIRRTRREQEAYVQNTLEETAFDETWKQIGPLLDAAMAGLNETDRHAVVLRFFDGKSMSEVGTALGASEEAAKKRVNRALEKLRKFFTKRGVVSTTAIIATVISTNSVQAAPAAMAKSVTAIALAKGTTASISTLTLVKGALKVMAWTKTQMAVVIGIGVLLAAGTTTITVKEIQEHRSYSWEVPQADFDVFNKTPPQFIIVPTKFNTNGDWLFDSSHGTMGICQPLEQIIQIAYQKNYLRTVVNVKLPAQKYDFFVKPSESPDSHDPPKWAIALQKEVVRKFGVIGHLEMRKTNVLVLEPNSTGTKNFKMSHIPIPPDGLGNVAVGEWFFAVFGGMPTGGKRIWMGCSNWTERKTAWPDLRRIGRDYMQTIHLEALANSVLGIRPQRGASFGPQAAPLLVLAGSRLRNLFHWK